VARRQAAVMLINLILVAGALGSGSISTDSKPKVEWTAPVVYLGSGGFPVHVVLTTGSDAASVPAWAVEASAFTLNGKPLGEKRGEGSIQLLPNTRLAIDLDLAPVLAKAEGLDGKDFKIGYAKEILGTEEKGVRVMQAAEKGLDFMKMPVEDLSKYHVIMSTNQGDMEIEFWPDVAPNHVRNFLDLSYTGFYDGKTFHRVIPGFMIQGGDPTGTGTGSGPRMLKAEFNNKKHLPGVLSMARSQDPNSASCQFFIVHKTASSLDGQYSGFGQLVSGLEVVDKIVNVKRNSQDKPFEQQTIKKCTVVRVGGK
jgi:peptidyl-prolyl cis-trans isomerase B (cyclophilin B)